MEKKAPFQKSQITEAELDYQAEKLIEALQPDRAYQGGVTSLVGFWTGNIFDISTVDVDHMITVRIGGDGQQAHCNLNSSELTVGSKCFGYINQAGEYIYLGDVSASATHSHFYCENLLGVIDGANTGFASPFYFKTDMECVMVNGVAQRRNVDYTPVESIYVTMTVAPEPGDSLQISGIRDFPSQSFGDGKYIFAADMEYGWVVRCQDVFVGAPSWEKVTQGILGSQGDVYDICIPPWAPAGMVLLCGNQGVWRASNAFATDPADVVWVQVLTADEISNATDSTKTRRPFEFALDETNKRIYLAVVVQDRGVWTACSDNLGASWSWSTVATGFPDVGALTIVWKHRIEIGATGYIYVSTYNQHDHVYRSIDDGQTFALVSSVASADWNGTGVIIHKNQAADTDLVVFHWNSNACTYSDDGTWPPNASAGLPDDLFAMRAAQYDPSDDDVLYAVVDTGAGSFGCYKSVDHGQNFSKVGDVKPTGPGDPGTIGSIIVFERNSNYLYAGGDGTGVDTDWGVIFVSTDAALNWADKTGSYYADMGLGAGSKPRLVRILPAVKEVA